MRSDDVSGGAFNTARIVLRDAGAIPMASRSSSSIAERHESSTPCSANFWARSESPHASRAARRRRASPPLAFVGDAMDATDAMGETVKIRWRARKDVATSQAGEGLYV